MFQILLHSSPGTMGRERWWRWRDVGPPGGGPYRSQIPHARPDSRLGMSGTPCEANYLMATLLRESAKGANTLLLDTRGTFDVTRASCSIFKFETLLTVEKQFEFGINLH